jgi:hypothetical protein
LSHVSNVDFTALSVREENMTFQPDPDIIIWKIHFNSTVQDVYNINRTTNKEKLNENFTHECICR